MINWKFFIKITGLAMGDAVNPCALAVLTMVLMTILIQNPNKKRKILFAGLAFTASVYIGYLFYGVVLVNIFNSFATSLREQASIFYNSLAILIMIIGALNIKDFFLYKPGGIATEMPIFMRPKVKKTISRMTSPYGAFVIGFLVTLFLLPCTIGPYIGASGELSTLTFIGTIPWLLYYNLIFVLPMILITFLVYWKLTKVEDVSGWKDRNIKWLHLIAGILLFSVGLSLLLGWL